MLLKPGTARLWRLSSSGKIVWAVVKFQRWHFMVQNLKLFSAYKAGYKLKHTISTEQNSSLLTKGRKNGTVCMTKSPKISLYLLRNFTFIMHSFCLQGDRRWGGKSDMKIWANVFILNFEISPGISAGPSGKGKSHIFFSCGRVQQQHDWSEANVKSTEDINPFYTTRK